MAFDAPEPILQRMQAAKPDIEKHNQPKRGPCSWR
jgi:hypothetical protein